MIRDLLNSNGKTLSNVYGITMDQAINFLPVGWHKFIDVMFNTANLCQTNIHTLDIKNGTLYVKGEGVHQDVFNRVTRTIMIDSALTCMVCGNYGRRRKDEDKSPSLCGSHYLNYINEE